MTIQANLTIKKLKATKRFQVCFRLISVHTKRANELELAHPLSYREISTGRK